MSGTGSLLASAEAYSEGQAAKLDEQNTRLAELTEKLAAVTSKLDELAT